MDKEELREILRKHDLYLNGERGGDRADLRWADLREANLHEANLHEADLREADLSEADLRWANLRGANLHGANLSEANLSEAKNFLFLPTQDLRGYSFCHAVYCDEWMIRAGCRDFTIEQAKQHWGESYAGNREQGDMYLAAIDWLEKKIERDGLQEGHK